MKIKEDIKSLSGPEKAASLVLALNTDQASRIMSLLAQDEIKELSQAMAGLGTVGSGIIENLCLEFSTQISSSGTLIGSFDTTERFLKKVLDGKQVSAIMEDIRGPAGRTMWDKLGNVNENILASYLRNEYPQTAAVVLSKIKSEHAGKVLAVLPEQFAIEVISRLLKMEHVKKEILNDIEKTLKTEFMSNLARTNRQDPHELMADIFNNLDRATENRFMSALEQTDSEASERIKALMFTFEDLSRLDDQGIQALLRNVDKDKLGVALKGASDELKNMFFGNMSERAGKILKEDMEAAGPMRLKDVESAQTEIIKLAKDMASRDELLLSSGSSEDEMVG
jgi:flagellar motor switch protein FliG